MIIRCLAPILMLSGALSLVYQVCWVRGLTLLLGSTTLAMTTVVSTFMGGLALGALLANRFLLTTEKPLRWYGGMEVTVAIAALISPLLLELQHDLVPPLLTHWSGSPVGSMVIQITACSLLLLIPTCAMGASLPVLARFVERNSNSPASAISTLYGVNTIGACLGCLVGGFYLLPKLGLYSSLTLSGSINAALAIVVLLLSHLSMKTHLKTPPLDQQATASGKDARKEGPGSIPLRPGSAIQAVVLLLLSFIAGAVGLICELVWTRLLVLCVGGTIYAFSAILSVFLASYGIGTYFSGRYLAKRPTVTAGFIAGTFLVTGFAICFSLAIVNTIPDSYIQNFSEEKSTTALGTLSLLLTPSIGMISLPSLFFGFTFPLLLARLSSLSGQVSTSTAVLYGCNTIGAIFGTITAAFVLIPLFGLDSALRIAAGLMSICSIIMLPFLILKGRKIVVVAANALLLCTAIILTPKINPLVLTAGAGTYATFYKNEIKEHRRGVLQSVERSQDLLYYEDGFTATVSVTQDKLSENNDIYISTNGKIDGSSHFDMPTQKLSAHFPALMHVDPKTACVIGFGTGTTVGSLALHREISVDAVEIESAVVRGAEFLNDFNNRPLEQENVSLLITDARLHLLLRPDSYDLIISEPSNPWIAGVADLFTDTFYQIGRKSLRKGGIFAQWVQMYTLDTESVTTIIKTFQSVFPNSYLVVTLPGSDLLLLGFTDDVRPSLESIRARMAKDAILADLAESNVRIHSAEDLLARLLLGPEQLNTIAGEATINTDNLPVLSYKAPLSLFLETRKKNMQLILDARQNVQELLSWDVSEETNNAFREAQLRFFEKYQLHELVDQSN